MTDTIVGIATAAGEGGVAIVRMSGDGAIAIFENAFRARKRHPCNFGRSRIHAPLDIRSKCHSLKREFIRRVLLRLLEPATECCGVLFLDRERRREHASRITKTSAKFSVTFFVDVACNHGIGAVGIVKILNNPKLSIVVIGYLDEVAFLEFSSIVAARAP